MKNKKETIAKGIMALLFSQILIKVVGLVYKLYLTNREGFGDAGNAIYSAGFQIYALLLTFSSTGMPNAIAKLVSERVAIGDNRGAYRIFKIAFYTFAFFGLIGTVVLFLGAKVIATKWLEIPEAEYCLITLAPSIFFVSITSVLRGYFNGRQSLSVTAKSQGLEQIFKTVFTILLVEMVANLSKNNTILMAGVANLATTVATFFSFSYIYLYYRLKRKEIAQEVSESVNYVPTRVRKTLKKILKESFPISLSSLMSSFNKNIDLFTIVRLLKRFMTEKQAKIQYGILSGKVDMLCVLPLSLNIPFSTAIVPAISRAIAKKDMRDVSNKISVFLKMTMLISLPSAVGIIIFARPILNLLFPNANDGAILLQVSSISIIFSMFAQTINSILQGIGKINVPAISFFIGMIFKFLTNLILVGNSDIGIIGAAIGNIVCNLIVCVVGFCVLSRSIKFNFNMKNTFLKPIVAIFLMSICSITIFYCLNRIISENMATILAILSAIFVYLISIIVMKAVPIFDDFAMKFKKN